MNYDILKTFRYSHDGVTEMMALEGAENVELPAGAVEGLRVAGMICESKMERKIVESAPETGAVVTGAVVAIDNDIPVSEQPMINEDISVDSGSATNGLPPAATLPPAALPPFVQPDEVVEIPDDWKTMHWTHRVQLAQQFNPDIEMDNDKAIEIIQGIVDSRASFTG